MVLAGFLAFFAVSFFWARTRGAAIDELPPDHVRMTVTTAQGDRQWVMHVPPSCDKSTPTPLVIMLHGFGGTGWSAAKETLWSAKADRESFIIAYPEATRPDQTTPQNFRKNPQAWNDGSGRFHAAAEKIDDVAFINAMIERIDKDHAIDPDRIFATGFSNGASMALSLECGAFASRRRDRPGRRHQLDRQPCAIGSDFDLLHHRDCRYVKSDRRRISQVSDRQTRSRRTGQAASRGLYRPMGKVARMP